MVATHSDQPLTAATHCDHPWLPLCGGRSLNASEKRLMRGQTLLLDLSCGDHEHHCCTRDL